ncbi:aldehyde dehydrogenase [Roseovarius sp. 2305UL8-3]|uniref:aldehyde dehydrogenase n=1 Tax=Roseovarius conchicola TaxID=3121636 RepID=UPI003526EE54
MTTQREIFVAGHWVRGSGPTVRSTNPADGSELAEIAGAATADLDKAVAGARAAMENPEWRDLMPHQRAALLHRFGALIDGDADTLARIQLSDNGKTLTECRGMIASAANTFRYYAAACETGEGSVTPPRGQYHSLCRFAPVGVVGAITPWNSPATLEAQKLAPILAAGNAVILKPSEVTPLMGLEYARLAEKAGFPAGVLSVLVGDLELGKSMVTHPGIDMISFTGGTVGGRHIAAAAGAQLKPLVLELGGKSPNIVFADADLDRAVAGVAGGIFSGAGESCVAGSRIFVEASLFDAFCERLVAKAQSMKVGRPEADGVEIGPLIHAAHRDAVHGHVTRAVQAGATLLTGGTIPDAPELQGGFYYPPTLLTGVGNEADICQQEVFGPVGVILPFADEDDLLAQANDSEFGLASGIWTSNLERAWYVADRLQAGTVWINTYKQLSISTPFDGHKASGLGREKGFQGMRAYQQTQAVFWSKGG